MRTYLAGIQVMKIDKKRGKNTLGKPHGYLLLAFSLEIILVCLIFFLGGKNFFMNDLTRIGIILPLGILTFVSVFFGFIFSNQKSLMESFEKMIQNKEKGFEEEFKKIDYKDKNKIQDFMARHHNIKEYKWFVNPYLWLFMSVFLSIISILINLATISSKELIISISIHLSILTTFFLITSIASLIICYYFRK